MMYEPPAFDPWRLPKDERIRLLEAKVAFLLGAGGGGRAGVGRRPAPAARPAKHARRGRLPPAPRAHQDRKSTRLNSSHITISYAVFCL